MNSVYLSALTRSMALVLAAFAGGFFTDALAGSGIAHALLVGGGAAVPVFAVRFGGEGTYDTKRDGGS